MNKQDIRYFICQKLGYDYGLKGRQESLIVESDIDDIVEIVQAHISEAERRAKVQLEHDIFSDLSQRMNYADYSGQEPSKAWKKLWYHIEGGLDNAKKRLAHLQQPKEEKEGRS